MKLRTVEEKDCQLLFRWANDPDVRKNAFKSQKINWKSHVSWFKDKINNPSTIIFILEKDNCPIGQVRYDYNKEENLWILDYSIDIQFRGMGLGKKIIELSLNQISGTVTANVKEDNIPSCNIFEKLGFQEMGKENNFVKYKYN